MTSDLHHSKFQGSLVGGALGDAIGELASSHPDRAVLLAQIEQGKQLRYTDDTIMTLSVAETLVEFGDIDPQVLGNLFQASYYKEPWRGYSESIRNIYEQVKNEGIGYLDASSRLYGGAGSYGNGAAIRIAPVALYYHRSAALYDKVSVTSRITHAHPTAVDGAAVLAQAHVRALGMNAQRPFSPEALIEDITEMARTHEIREKLELLAGLLGTGAGPAEAARTLGLSTAAHESIPFALYSFLSHPHEFMECILCAVLNGGDRKAMGAIAGGLSGTFLGMEAIPEPWRGKLENGQHFETLARELAARSP